MAEIRVPIRSRRRMRAALLQHLQHVLPAPQLLIHGVERITDSPPFGDILLGGAEIVVSALVIVAFVRAIRRYRQSRTHSGHRAHGSVDWLDVLLAGMLLTEAAAHWHETGSWRRPTLLTAGVMLALGLLHGWLAAKGERRCALRVTDDGVTMGLRFFRRFSARWADIERIDLDTAPARIVTRTGRTQTFDFEDLEGAERVKAALEVARQRALDARAAG
jgi:hypothetical protein